MLRVINLVKRYQTKGEVVTALNGVSVDFPETGMVFLLGKSGSGKSTLLNVSGGLDTPDEGEIIVKGKSSRDFSQSDFDAYRNTYVGFIFQEYNVLNEFTVKENVALALELQGKPRDEALIDSLLKQVEMSEMADRRPNTLSGGQKQRVAIARALVKNPEIIMADEPTGALDSETGRQVFDTLKKLSAEKLVVVVSHDREFAETYADRIIELKDGCIVSDVSRGTDGQEHANVCSLSEKKISIGCGAALTREEMEKVCAFLKNGKGKFVISAEEEDLKNLPAERQSGGFSQTTQTRARVYEKDESKFIKSKFPLRHAVRMGLSGLRFKPIRLAVTVVLSTLAFLVFGMFSTLITFDQSKVAANTLYESQYTGAIVSKKAIAHFKEAVSGKAVTMEFGTGNAGARFTQEEIETFQKEYPQLEFIPAYDMNLAGGLEFKETSMGYSESTNYYYRQLTSFRAFADVAAIRDKSDYTLVAGKYPEKENECLISTKVYEAFCLYGHASSEGVTPVRSYEDMIGKSIPLVADFSSRITLKVTGILETHESFAAYEHLKDPAVAADFKSYEDEIAEYKTVYLNSISSIAFVSGGFREFYGRFDAETDRVQKEINELSMKYGPWNNYRRFTGSSYQEPDEAYCQFLIASLKNDRRKKCDLMMRAINESGDADRDLVYKVNTLSFTSEISSGKNIIDDMMPILGGASGVLALFSALLLFNFISASVNGKKKDIGILRAVGARGIDVFKIFFAEALAVTTLCFALACGGSAIGCAIVNGSFISRGVLTFKILLFDGLNALFVLAISLLTALLATVIPVRSLVKKKPVEAIRAL